MKVKNAISMKESLPLYEIPSYYGLENRGSILRRDRDFLFATTSTLVMNVRDYSQVLKWLVFSI
jgi:hypothetical protein